MMYDLLRCTVQYCTRQRRARRQPAADVLPRLFLVRNLLETSEFLAFDRGACTAPAVGRQLQ